MAPPSAPPTSAIMNQPSRMALRRMSMPIRWKSSESKKASRRETPTKAQAANQRTRFVQAWPWTSAGAKRRVPASRADWNNGAAMAMARRMATTRHSSPEVQPPGLPFQKKTKAATSPQPSPNKADHCQRVRSSVKAKLIPPTARKEAKATRSGSSLQRARPSFRMRSKTMPPIVPSSARKTARTGQAS
jgi:hypothetical protein